MHVNARGNDSAGTVKHRAPSLPPDVFALVPHNNTQTHTGIKRIKMYILHVSFISADIGSALTETRNFRVSLIADCQRLMIDRPSCTDD